ncbi:MAG: hypothetical protein DWQ18_03940 [Crenarchaeota archaeon]|nr:MAG: hypothetical protein DWQ17_09190 [Thermoproteota archaeon]RDJ34060.1 MAG: hypothetical protein DWQ18_03940 [Thermoproteota archaeon]RDJ36825.1 MAG: hypothetical protein DWQ13_06675 [Thermoproteota archaeon]RDJ37640.1 MAG: hypothetical protein DWQ19_04160 [Thermoproteota archaeon]
MGYGRKPRRHSNRDYRKGRAKPKLAVIGAIVLGIGILVMLYGSSFVDFEKRMLIGVATIPTGVIMLLLSMRKKDQIRFAKGMERASDVFKDDCQCCKCQNCGRDHNHWVHD